LESAGKLGLVEGGPGREHPADYLVGELEAKRLGKRRAIPTNASSDPSAWGRISQRGDQ
jgi:hypothetical protein